MKRELALATLVEITGIYSLSIEHRRGKLTVLIRNARDHRLIRDLLASTLNFVRNNKVESKGAAIRVSSYPIKFYLELFRREFDGAQNTKPTITRHRSDHVTAMAKRK